MTQAIGDPDKLESFAYHMRQFLDSINDAVGIPQRRFRFSWSCLAERRAGALWGGLSRTIPPVPPVPPVQFERGRADPVARPEGSP
jgi:hypothetical protein